jgi:hypothetical protein
MSQYWVGFVIGFVWVSAFVLGIHFVRFIP